MKIPEFPGKQERQKKWGERLVAMQLKVPPEVKQAVGEFAARQPGHPPVSVVVEETLYRAYPEIKKEARRIKKENQNAKKKLIGSQAEG